VWVPGGEVGISLSLSFMIVQSAPIAEDGANSIQRELTLEEVEQEFDFTIYFHKLKMKWALEY
jgi:hypothetical protein